MDLRPERGQEAAKGTEEITARAPSRGNASTETVNRRESCAEITRRTASLTSVAFCRADS